ncbi:MAG: glycosyltransferase family 87 protein [Candidatus Promineifilaceae bacterium]
MTLNEENNNTKWWDSLWLPIVLSLGGYVIIAVWFPLFPGYNYVPLADINTFVNAVPAVLAYIFLFSALYFLYHRLYQMVQKRGLSLGVILLVGVLFALPLLVTFPVNATDVYRYFIRGRITSVHHESPYLVTAAELGDTEPYRLLAGEWANKTSPYGPLWESLAAVVTAIVPENLALALLTFKGVAVICHLLVGALIWLSLRGKSAAFQAGRTVLWLWNPALLLIFGVNAHNDGLMLVWLALAWWLMTRERFQWAMVVVVLAPLSKPIGLLALPFFFLAALRRMEDVRSKVRFFVITAVTWLALGWLLFLPFGPPLSLAQRLVAEVGSGGEFSFLALFFLVTKSLGFTVTAASIELAPRITAVLFLILAAWLMWRTWRGRLALRGTADILTGYLVQSFVFRIWYTAWPFPWLVLDTAEDESDPGDGKRFSWGRLKTAEGRLYAGFWFLFTAQLSVLIYGQIRTHLLLGQHVYAHLIGVPFTFLLPLILACFARRPLRQK